MSRYEHLLRNYAALLGLEPVQQLLTTQELVVSGITVSLMLDGDKDIGDVVFCTNLGIPTTEMTPERLYSLLLQANGLWAGTNGYTLGLQHGTNAVLLAGRAPLPLCHAKGFADSIGAFVDTALPWRAVIKGQTLNTLPTQQAPMVAAAPDFA